MDNTPSNDLIPYEYQGIPILVDQSAEPWMTQKQMAELLGITKQSVSDILKVAFRRQFLLQEDVVISPITSQDGKKYKTKVYSPKAVAYLKSHSFAQLSKSDRERAELHHIARAYLETLFEKLEYEVRMPIEGRADFVCYLGDKVFIYEVKGVPFKTRHIEQILDYCHQWEFAFGKKPQPNLLYVGCDAKANHAYCGFLGTSIYNLQ